MKVPESEIITISKAGIEFNDAEKEIVAKAINYFGSGQHPWADESTLHDFAVAYAIVCMKEGARMGVPAQFRDEFDSAFVKLENSL